ncbi:MAG: SH3 domain-containing protein [Tannerella sp.]|jgi:hypothetical protein|nr:SH3 domain-containing protein [Tannerella sp.]
MKRVIYIAAICIVATAVAGAQARYGREGTDRTRPSHIRTGGDLRQEWGYMDIYPKKKINRPYLKEDCYDGTYYPHYVAVRSLFVRNAPSYDAPVLTTIAQGEVIHLTDADYPWKKMAITYFDTEAWVYRTTVGYVNCQLVRSAAPSPANKTGRTSAPAYVADPDGRRNRPSQSRPIIDRTRTGRPAIVGQNGEAGCGRLTVWTNCEDDGYIDVYIDGDYAGQLTTSFYGTDPACGEEGTIARELPAGRHDISAFGSTGMWNVEAIVVPGRCTLKLLSREDKEKVRED